MKSQYLVGLLASSVSLSSVYADNAMVAAEIELPTMRVNDTRALAKPEEWSYGQVPSFDVISSAPNRVTQQLISSFYLFEQALDIVWPGLRDSTQSPLTIVLAGKGEFEDFKPKQTDDTKHLGGTASLLLAKGDRRYIVVNLSVSDLFIAGAPRDGSNDSVDEYLGEERVGGRLGGVTVDYEAQLRREYVRMLLEKLNPRFPVWVEEGLAQLLRGMDVDHQRIRFAKVEGLQLTRNSPGAQTAESEALGSMGNGSAHDGAVMRGGQGSMDSGFHSAFVERGLMSFPEMFAVERDSPEVQNSIGGLWGKQCYAFVHLCLYGEGQRYQKPFLTFLNRLRSEPVSEELFKECFGMDYRKMATTMRAYITDTASKSYTFTPAKKSGRKNLFDQTPIEFRLAKQSELAQVKGALYEISGRTDDARAELFLAYRRGEREPALLAEIGLLELSLGETERARKFLEESVKAGIVQPAAYLALANLRWTDLAKEFGGETKIPADRIEPVTSLLRTAANQPNPPVVIFERLVKIFEQVNQRISPADEKLLVQACVWYPHNLRLAFSTARLCAQGTRLSDAHALAEHGLRYAPDEATKQGFASLKASLPAAPRGE
jgi:hypothetical protein